MQRLRSISARLAPEHSFLSFRAGPLLLPLCPLRLSPFPSPLLTRSLSTSPSRLSRIPPMMDDSIKQHYLADSPPTVVKLEVKSHFDNLQDEKLRKYAHFISR